MGICQIVGGIFYTCWWCNRSETLRITKGIFFWELWAVLQNTLYFSFVQSGEGTDDIIPLFQFRCWGGETVTIPAAIGWEVGYKLDSSPVCLSANAQRPTATLTFTPTASLELDLT